MTTEAFEINAAARRRERDALLAQTIDRINPIWWAAMTPAQQSAWAAYRQALLDISLQPEFPFAVTWPAQPE